MKRHFVAFCLAFTKIYSTRFFLRTPAREITADYHAIPENPKTPPVVKYILTCICVSTLFLLSPLSFCPGADIPPSSSPPAPPNGAPEFAPLVQPSHGQHLALTLKKLRDPPRPRRPFLIWALGSSYTNMLGNGEFWQEHIPRLFANAPPIEYRKMVGNSCPWQYLRGWAGHLVLPDQPDLVLVYTIGRPEHLEALLVDLRKSTTADIIVPSIHWRERDQRLFGHSEDAADQDVSAVREICARHGVEFVENRKAWGDYLVENDLPIPALLKDPVHQSDYGREIINRNILSHFRTPQEFSYDPETRERIIARDIQIPPGESREFSFEGTRLDLVSRAHPGGGSLHVDIDGQPAASFPAFLMTYVQPGKSNYHAKGVIPRDNAPHGITLGKEIVPQTWTLTVTSDQADFTLRGSVTGPDGAGNATEPFHSDSGQITIEPGLWRRSERNRAGDSFTFDVYRSTVAEVTFPAEKEESPSRVRLAQNLPNGPHTIRLVNQGSREVTVEFLEAFTPPLK